MAPPNSWVTAFDRGERRRLAAFFGVVAFLHALGLGFLLSFGGGNPALAGLGLLAYTLGLRHAFDADHIAAIDNVTRKLLQQQRRPVGTGFFFSMGHSTTVFLIALFLALAARSVIGGVAWHDIGGFAGTAVSGVFLLVIGVLNLMTLLDIGRVYRRMGRGGVDRGALETELVAGGLFTRLFAGVFRFVDQSWHLYPIGALFGLGFDTATEVALLGVSAGAAAKGVGFFAVISLPLLFTAGMAVMDTTDGAFMSKAYTWAFSNPIRKVFYNLTITSLSVLIALFVGLVEVAQMMGAAVSARGLLWDVIQGLDFEAVGFVIVATFVVTWVGAFAYFKLRRVEERWAARFPGHGD